MLFRSIVVDIGPSGLACLGDPALERIWCCLGTYPEDQTLTVADEDALVVAQSLGKHIYVESGDQWGFAGVTTFGNIDGVAPPYVDGNDSFLSMDGADSGFGLDLSANLGVAYTQDNAANDWTDQILPSTTDALGPNAGVIWRQAGGAYNTGIHYDTDTGGKVICQTWEFGGYGGDQNALAAAYLTVLGGGPAVPQFQRADCNADGLRNIADAIYGLGALFPPPGGSPNLPSCRDSCDANDDGAFNIADMIHLLGSLFPPGGGPPSVIPPPFGVCGGDPTADPLDCVSFPPC